MTRAALYAPDSSEGQREASITDQYRNCERRAKQDGWTITARYEDKAISGSQDADGRPGYKEMLKDAEAKGFDVLLVDDLSRLSRDHIETEKARRRLVFWGIRLIGVSDGIDTAGKGHKMLSGVKGLMNEVFLDNLRDKTSQGMIGQTLQGYDCGGRAYGYRLVPEFDPSKKDPYGQPARIGTRLEKHPEQAPWVEWIFERYAEGWSPLKIVEELNRRQVTPPGAAFWRRSMRPPTWCASALHGDINQGTGLLNNHLYVGQYIWNRARWYRHPDTKKSKRTLRNKSEWIITPAPHLRIINDALWERVKARQQEVRQQSAAIRAALHLNPTTSTGRGPKYLFSSLLVCGQCGNKFIIVDPKRYGCSGRLYRGTSVCSNTIKVSQKVVESVLLASIQHDLFTQQGFTVFKQEVTRLLAERRRTQAPDQERATRRLEQVEREIANIMTAIKQGILTASTKAELEKAEAERGWLQGLIKTRTDKADNLALLLPNLKEQFTVLVANLATVTHQHVDRARAMLKSLLGRQIALHQCADGADRYLTAEVSGNYAGLLRLALGKNKDGGGQAMQLSLTPLLRFEVQGVALAA
jgi:DNA invertase Pin-like site-specific DNA recombinase